MTPINELKQQISILQEKENLPIQGKVNSTALEAIGKVKAIFVHCTVHDLRTLEKLYAILDEYPEDIDITEVAFRNFPVEITGYCIGNLRQEVADRLAAVQKVEKVGREILEAERSKVVFENIKLDKAYIRASFLEFRAVVKGAGDIEAAIKNYIFKSRRGHPRLAISLDEEVKYLKKILTGGLEFQYISKENLNFPDRNRVREALDRISFNFYEIKTGRVQEPSQLVSEKLEEYKTRDKENKDREKILSNVERFLEPHIKGYRTVKWMSPLAFLSAIKNELLEDRKKNPRFIIGIEEEIQIWKQLFEKAKQEGKISESRHAFFTTEVFTNVRFEVNEGKERVFKEAIQFLERHRDLDSKEIDFANVIKKYILEHQSDSAAILSLDEQLVIWEEAIRSKPHQEFFLRSLKFIRFSQVVLKLPQGADVEKTLADKIAELREERLYRLQNLQAVYRDMFPEGKPRFPGQAVTTKCFPTTKAWYVGAINTGEVVSKKPQKAAEIEMQNIGSQHGIDVISDTTADKRSSAVRSLQKLLILDYRNSEANFPQDFVDFGLEIQVPRMSEGDDENDEMTDAIREARNRRNQEAWSDLKSHYLKAESTRGEAFDSNYAKKAIFLGCALRVPMSMNLTYNEGGNTLLGESLVEGEMRPYAIIGKDAYAATAYLLKKDLGRDVNDDEIKIAFAIDYGIPKESIYFIEQPGDFHLDMSMTIIQGKTVLINDSRASHEVFKDHPNRLTRLRRQTKNVEQVNKTIEEIAVSKLEFEEQIASDLKRQGFEVIPYPGRFDYTGDDPAMNFFNMVTARTSDGKKIVITFGCVDADYEQRFRDLIRRYHPDIEEKHIYFLDLEFSQDCLLRSGGPSCRSKV